MRAHPPAIGHGASDPPIVVALGGNAIVRRGESGTIEQQALRAREALTPVADLVAAGRSVVLTHGNGPVVGNIIMRNEAARDIVPPMPLYIAGADSEGGIGFMLQNTLHNLLAERDLPRPVVTLVTQVVVDPADPAFGIADKPIGPYLGRPEADLLGAERGWSFAEAGDGPLRRVVPSPRPLRVVEAPAVGTLAAAGQVVIAAGGGGVPVVERPDGTLEPVEAVVDKDWTSALLACEIGASALAVLMEADGLYRDWGTPTAERIERLTVTEARELIDGGSLARGSIAPKVAACAWFAAECRASAGHAPAEAVICASDALADALAGRAGTRISRE